MVKPVRPFVNRDDYEWFVKRFGDDGIAPSKGELFSRVHAHINHLESELTTIGKVIQENEK